MPIINLIQEQRLAASRREQQTRIAMMTLLGTGVLGVIGYGIIFFEGQALSAQISQLKVDLEKTAPIVKEIEANEKEKSELQPRLDSLVAARDMSTRWAAILTRLQTQTPPQAWLTGLQSTGADQNKPINIIFTGTGEQQQTIAEFVLRAQNDVNLDNVVLHFTQEKRSQNGTAIDFEIGAELVGSQEKKKASLKEETKS